MNDKWINKEMERKLTKQKRRVFWIRVKSKEVVGLRTKGLKIIKLYYIHVLFSPTNKTIVYFMHTLIE